MKAYGYNPLINAAVRYCEGRVELYEGSTLLNTYSAQDDLISFSLERVGDNTKFFGYGVCQKTNIKLLDINRTKDIKTAHSFTLNMSMGEAAHQAISPFMNVTEVHRDENTNQLSVTAYDAIYKATEHIVSELNLETYTLRELAVACARIIGCSDIITDADNDLFDLFTDADANLDGTETIREVMNAIAEVTQTIYYVDAWTNFIVFKRLDKDGLAVMTIDKSKYITLDSKTNRRLSAIANITELGENIEARLEESGTTQYIRNNPFYALLDAEVVAERITDALNLMGGLTICQFECKWRGNHALEIGDKLALITKDDDVVFTYLLDDTITYDGAFIQDSRWSFSDASAVPPTNSANLGEALKDTFAKVDKVNREITLVASKVDANTSEISALQLNTDSINASVTKTQKEVSEALDNINATLESITTKVEGTITHDELTIEIKKELDNGISKVETTTGYVFDEEGLRVSKSESEMSTLITEDGMTVSKNNSVVLTANNVGVQAINLHAEDYLIIGKNSRFEDYGSDRTGCFWIGGN